MIPWRRVLREVTVLIAAVIAATICGYAGFRHPHCLAAAVITVMLLKADRIAHRRENPWFKHAAPFDPSPKRVTERISVGRQARRARVWGSSFGSEETWAPMRNARRSCFEMLARSCCDKSDTQSGDCPTAASS